MRIIYKNKVIEVTFAEVLESGNGINIYQGKNLTLLIRNIPIEYSMGLINAMAVQGYLNLNKLPSNVSVEYRRFVS